MEKQPEDLAGTDIAGTDTTPQPLDFQALELFRGAFSRDWNFLFHRKCCARMPLCRYATLDIGAWLNHRRVVPRVGQEMYHACFVGRGFPSFAHIA
jgi:hypothetical protein